MSLQESGVRKTRRLRASRRRRTSDVRAIASTCAGAGVPRPPPAAPASGRTTPRRPGSRRRRRRSRRRRPPRGPSGSARPAGGTRARSMRGAPRGSRPGRDSAREPVRGPGWRAGRRARGPRDRGAAAPGATPRPGRGSRHPPNGRRGRCGCSPVGRRSPGIPARSSSGASEDRRTRRSRARPARISRAVRTSMPASQIDRAHDFARRSARDGQGSAAVAGMGADSGAAGPYGVLSLEPRPDRATGAIEIGRTVLGGSGAGTTTIGGAGSLGSPSTTRGSSATGFAGGASGTLTIGGTIASTAIVATPSMAPRQRATRHRGSRPARAAMPPARPGPAAPSTWRPGPARSRRPTGARRPRRRTRMRSFPPPLAIVLGFEGPGDCLFQRVPTQVLGQDAAIRADEERRRDRTDVVTPR